MIEAKKRDSKALLTCQIRPVPVTLGQLRKDPLGMSRTDHYNMPNGVPELGTDVRTRDLRKVVAGVKS